MKVSIELRAMKLSCYFQISDIPKTSFGSAAVLLADTFFSFVLTHHESTVMVCSMHVIDLCVGDFNFRTTKRFFIKIYWHHPC